MFSEIVRVEFVEAASAEDHVIANWPCPWPNFLTAATKSAPTTDDDDDEYATPLFSSSS